MPLTPEEWTLLVVAQAKGGAISPVQLQKALFLVGENLKPGEGFYRFAAYDYGPFCKAVYSDAEQLEQQGLISIAQSPWVGREYLATKAGVDTAAALASHMRPEHVDYLARVVAWVRSLSFKDLVMAIYEAYPSMRANSVFRY